MTDRKGEWMQTFSGRRFWPEDPRVGDFHLIDIAHHLATSNRFNGAALEPYSIAQHSILVSYLCDPEDALEGLMHDAFEAYLGDLIRPVKHFGALGAEYRKLEAIGEPVLAQHFGLKFPWPASVKHADNVALATELRDLLAECEVEWGQLPPPTPHARIERALSWDLAKMMFVRRFDQLGGYERITV